MKEFYPTVPNYNGDMYIFFETAKVREVADEDENSDEDIADWNDEYEDKLESKDMSEDSEDD